MIEWKPLIPGALGAALAACMGPERGKIDRLIGFGVGFGFAAYCTDPTVDYFKLSSDTYSGGIGFVLGFFGMTVSDAIMRVIKDVKWDSIMALIKGKFGGGTGG